MLRREACQQAQSKGMPITSCIEIQSRVAAQRKRIGTGAVRRECEGQEFRAPLERGIWRHKGPIGSGKKRLSKSGRCGFGGGFGFSVGSLLRHYHFRRRCTCRASAAAQRNVWSCLKLKHGPHRVAQNKPVCGAWNSWSRGIPATWMQFSVQ